MFRSRFQALKLGLRVWVKVAFLKMGGMKG